MKILHTADLHLGDLNGPIINGKNARRLDTIECMAEIVSTAENEEAKGGRVNLAVIAGDLFNRSRVWADTALEDINDAIEELLRPLCKSCEQVVLLFGTQNHDNPRAFEVLAQTTRGESNLHILTEPDVYTLETSAGEVQILALPGFDKGRLRAFMPDADKEAENRSATALINDVLLGLSTKLDRAKPSVLLAHYTVAGSEAESGATFLAGQDVVLLPQTIDASGVTLGCLGHIHKPQKLSCNTPTFYSGSPNQLTFNDEGIPHGFYIHDLTDDVKPPRKYQGLEAFTGIWWLRHSDFSPTPEREHFTLRLSDHDITAFLREGNIDFTLLGDAPIEDKIVRVRYRATAEQEKALNKAELQKQLVNAGAFHVAEILAEDIDDGATLDTLDTEDTPYTALQRFLEMAETEPTDIARLQELAAPLISKADDGRETGQHTGAFVPRRIELKNYRSYASAEFDLDGIRMAMVNGPNGVGKSSLFMDSIVDALFEESRDEQLGGWLREGEKSGAVTFEFDTGGAGYRVARTRLKSGKGTLSFSRKNDSSEWEDCGDSTMKLTQAKIERALGMDCQTFCSIALIRQDAYGLFLEADSDRRMEVLSALLNLGIYVRLEDLAKANATEQKRLIAQTKDRMNVLADQICMRGELLSEGISLDVTIDGFTAELEVLDELIAAAQREEALRLEVARQAEEKENEASRYTYESNVKAADIARLQREHTDAQALADRLGDAEKATGIINAARGFLDLLAPAEAELRSLTERQAALQASLQDADTTLKSIKRDKEEYRALLGRRDEIESAAKGLEELSAARAALAKRGETYNAAWKAHNELQAAKKAFVAESTARISAVNQQIESAKEKAALLMDSGCPMPDGATCAFLKDAQEAERSLAELQKALNKVRAADREEYNKINAEAEAALKSLAAIKNPSGEADELIAQENKLRPVAALAPKLEAAAASVAGLEKQELDAREAIEKATADNMEINEKLPELKEQAAKADEARSTIRVNEETAKLLPECTAAKATAKALAERMEALQIDIGRLRSSAEGAAWEAEKIRERMPATTADPAALAAERKERSDKRNVAIGQRGGIHTQLKAVEEAQKQHDEYSGEVKAIARALADYQTLAKAFGIDGIQYMIIRGVVPEVMHRANEILAAMTGGRMAVDFRTEREQRSGKIVNSLDVWVTSIAGGSRPYSSHSGGEKVKIALAVTLGLADVKARRAGVQLGMLFIDEPPFLDSDGTEAYADALTNMAARNPGMRIMAISHDPTMKARFLQNITIATGENGSEVAVD